MWKNYPSATHTHFGSFELFLTLESFILYVSHPEPQVRYFLVQALGIRTELPLPFKLYQKHALGNFIRAVWERFQVFPPKGIKHYFQTGVPLERIWEAQSTHGDKSWTKRSVTVNYCETAFIPICNSATVLRLGEMKCRMLFKHTFTSLSINSFVIWYCASWFITMTPDYRRDCLWKFLTPTQSWDRIPVLCTLLLEGVATQLKERHSFLRDVYLLTFSVILFSVLFSLLLQCLCYQRGGQAAWVLSVGGTRVLLNILPDRSTHLCVFLLLSF